jgi:restriction system protein
MWLSLDRKIYQRFHDVIVPAEDGTTQIDHILISPFGVFVIETKNMTGWIFGSENQAQWTQSLPGGKKFRFQNPLRQNYRHTKCLSEHLDLNPEHLHSVVFFIGESTFKTPMPENVLDRGLGAYIRTFTDAVFTEAEVREIADSVRALKLNRTLNRRTHLKSLRDRHEPKDSCPKCGSDLVKKTARRGKNAGNEFMGCSTWPKCRFGRDL